jgi:tRNA1(Val) A37 N6-methylase TrmN6
MQRRHSEDSIFRKDLRILQPAKGYRFTVDSVLLAHFIRTEAPEEILEVGAGSGIVTILLSALQKFQSVVAVEIQSELADLCRANFESNRISRAKVYEADIKKLTLCLAPHSFDLIYSNPPYRKSGSGKLNPSTQKAIARHELRMKLEDLFVCAQTLLKPEGRLTTILPTFREKDFKHLTDKFEMHLCTRQYIHSFREKPPVFFLATVSRKAFPFQEHQPLVIYKERGKYTDEMNSLLNDE